MVATRSRVVLRSSSPVDVLVVMQARKRTALESSARLVELGGDKGRG